MDRAYSLMEVRAVSDDKRTFTGWATTPQVDRMGDIVDPLGAKFKNPLPLLHQHDHERPIGLVRFGKATADGIEFEAEIPVIHEPGLLKDRVDLAWGEIKAGLVRAVSIGFRVLEDGVERLKTGGLLFKSTEIMELSAVTIPANAQATITNVKSLCEGREDLDLIDILQAPDPAASGQTVHVAKLNQTARDGAPFVIRRINHLR
jgi:uncharacterized protein